MTTVVIIGAGMAGLAAAQVLQQHGIGCTLYEKSRGVGGRAATRRVGGFAFDHGAQYVKAPSAQLEELMHTSHAVDLGREVWTFDAQGRVYAGDPLQNADPKWTWAGGITSLAKTLAVSLDIRFDTQVAWLVRTPSDTYQIYADSGTLLAEADYVLLTPPTPQITQIVQASTLPADQQTHLLALLAPVSYRPCISVTLAYARRPDLPWYALINADRQHPITWLACEHDKPRRAPEPYALLTAQMSPEFSREHWDELVKGTYGTAGAPLPAAVQHIHAMIGAIVEQDLGVPLWANVQRWRYALPEAGVSFEQLNTTGSGLFFAGDFTSGRGRVHLAIESGWLAGERIVAAIHQRGAAR